MASSGTSSSQPWRMSKTRSRRRGNSLRWSRYGSLQREEFFMKAYAIAAETIKDQAMFDAYRKVVPETLVPFGGQFIARGGNLTVLEGEWPHPRLVIIEFPSRAAAEGWYRSAAYQKVISLRLNSSVGNLIIVDGSA